MLKNRDAAMHVLDRRVGVEVVIDYKLHDHGSPHGLLMTGFPTQNRTIEMPAQPPIGALIGAYIPGRVPASVYDHHEMAKDWYVIRSDASPDEVILDMWPPAGLPICVMLRGSTPVDGVVATVIVHHENGTKSRELGFLELIRDHHDERVPNAVSLTTRLDHEPNDRPMVYAVHTMREVIGWAYAEPKGAYIPPGRKPMAELFIDCEYEDFTRTLISMGIVTSSGQIYYAFDSKAAEDVRDPWVVKNVVDILLDVPPSTTVFDLNRNVKEGKEVVGFQSFLQHVIAQERFKPYYTDSTLVIHADFPTDIGYIAPLFHLGNGNRIRPMHQIKFIVDYVDSFPSKLKDPVQHNAAWDAFAMWVHMGYLATVDPSRIAGSKVPDALNFGDMEKRETPPAPPVKAHIGHVGRIPMRQTGKATAALKIQVENEIAKRERNPHDPAEAMRLRLAKAGKGSK